MPQPRIHDIKLCVEEEWATILHLNIIKINEAIDNVLATAANMKSNSLLQTLCSSHVISAKFGSKCNKKEALTAV